MTYTVAGLHSGHGESIVDHRPAISEEEVHELALWLQERGWAGGICLREAVEAIEQGRCSLDAAWQEAEAALPEGWSLRLVKGLLCVASAGLGGAAAVCYGYGDTPTAALQGSHRQAEGASGMSEPGRPLMNEGGWVDPDSDPRWRGIELPLRYHHGTFEPFTPPDDIDEGIRGWVNLLRFHGVETCQSCQGGPLHAYPHPTIDFLGDAHEGWYVVSIATRAAGFDGLRPVELRRRWDLDDGEPDRPVWQLVLAPVRGRPRPE